MACNVYPKLTDDQLDQLGSQAEAKFYKACRDQLPSSYFVFHSLSLVYQQSSNGKHGLGKVISLSETRMQVFSLLKSKAAEFVTTQVKVIIGFH